MNSLWTQHLRNEISGQWPRQTPSRISQCSDQEIIRSTTAKTVENFLGKDPLSLLGQGDIRKNITRKNKEVSYVPLTKEMEAEIRELFGDGRIV